MIYEFNRNFNEFKQNITLKQEQKSVLTDARRKVRTHIKQTFLERPQKYFNEDVIGILSSVAPQVKDFNHVFPRFMTQGSFAYNTLNYPDNPPAQQMDLDFGVYFPLTYVEDITGKNFQQAAIVLRGIVARCIEDFVREDPRWSFAKKEKCLRVIIAEDAHIDLPIYSIPDREFNTIVEQSALAELRASSMADYDIAKHVLLATDNGWIKSDPRVIYEWVVNSKREHEDNFLFYSRYIKAWRDHQRENNMYSILVMAAVCKALKELDDVSQNIALGLESVVRKFMFYLHNGGIKNPDPAVKENLDDNLNDSDKTRICDRLNNFANKLNRATKTGEVDILIGEFGTRFPNQSDCSSPSVGKVGALTAGISTTASAGVIKQSGVVWKLQKPH